MTERYDDTEPQEAPEPVVVRDRRKIDPETGELRPQADEIHEVHEVGGGAAPGADGTPGPTADAGVEASTVADLEKQLEERTNDLQRVQAEFANYRRRVDKEREQMTAAGKAAVVGELLPLIDDLERAEQHGDLTGAFKSVADKFIGVLERAGLESFGQEGEPFDPSVHEAVQHSTSPDVDGPTVTMVMRRGYRFSDRILRAALVGVTDHEPGPGQPEQAAERAEAPLGGAPGEQPVDVDDDNR